MPTIPMYGLPTARRLAGTLSQSAENIRPMALNIWQAGLQTERAKFDRLMNTILAKRQEREQQRAVRKAEGGTLGSKIGLGGGAIGGTLIGAPFGPMGMMIGAGVGGGLGGSVGGMFDSPGTTPAQVSQAGTRFGTEMRGLSDLPAPNTEYADWAPSSPHEYGVAPGGDILPMSQITQGGGAAGGISPFAMDRQSLLSMGAFPG